MAPQFELIDPAGQNYDLQSNTKGGYYNGFSQQLFDGGQPLWERNSRRNGYENEPSYFQFDGFSNRDGRFERVNDYRNPRTFDNPFTHLQNAHQTASAYGARAAMSEYQAAISAADRIDQRQVTRDMERNERALEQANARMMQAERMGASRQQMQAMRERRSEIEREQQFLDSMRMAPVYTRANAAFCFIAKGDNQIFRMGEHLLRQALDMSPDIEGNYYFNEHRDRAYMEHSRRLADEQRRRYPGNNNQPQRPLEVNPYEPQVPPRYEGPNPLRPPEQRPPVQRPPLGPQRPPVGPQRPPEQQNPPVPQRPPEQQNPPVPQRPPEENPPKPPVIDPNPETQQPVKPFDHTLLAPSGNLYSPAGPPGLGESAPGETFSSEKDGKGGWDIDWRELSTKKTDAQGNTVYNYKGEIDDSNGWLLGGLDGDTNFSAEETWSATGQMLKRVLTYDGSLTFNVKTDSGPRELKDVHKITTNYNEATKKFETEIECTNGAIYKAETDLTGKVFKFAEVQTKVNDDAVGLKQANVSNFANSGDSYHVARPIGIGGAIPGWAGGDNDVLDNRTAQVVRASNGNVTYKYTGEIEDSSGWTLGMNGDTNFEGQEILDSNNNLVSSFIKYGSAKDMKFIGVGGQPFSIADVTQVRTSREADGNFTSTVTDKKGTTWTIKFKPDGAVTEVR